MIPPDLLDQNAGAAPIWRISAAALLSDESLHSFRVEQEGENPKGAEQDSHGHVCIELDSPGKNRYGGDICGGVSF